MARMAWEKKKREETAVYDGGFFVCWLDPEPQETTGAIAVNDPLIPSVATSAHQGGLWCSENA